MIHEKGKLNIAPHVQSVRVFVVSISTDSGNGNNGFTCLQFQDDENVLPMNCWQFNFQIALTVFVVVDIEEWDHCVDHRQDIQLKYVFEMNLDSLASSI